MAVVMGVVSLILLIYKQEATAIGSNLPQVLSTFGAFAGFALVSGVASWSLHKNARWKWLAQGALAIAVVIMGLLTQQLG